MIFNEAMCLGVLLDSSLTFAPHVRCLSGKSSYRATTCNATHGTAMRKMSVSPSVRPSVCQTRGICGLWRNERKFCPDLYTT